ncbi:MAG: sialate O-acetylesterase [Bacteroidales bacterium]|nr:sialate O-acetylesterase [Candidatus Cacconaster scatequi]
MKLFPKLFLTLAAVAVCIPAFAGLSPKYPCSDGMVLQQRSSALVWGHGDAGKTVKVTTSWDGATYLATADESGVWRVYVNTPAASYTNHRIEVRSDSEEYVIKDVLVGEVWVASGQSNMEMPLRGFYNCPVENANYVMANPAGADNVRMFTVGIDPQFEPVSEVAETNGWEQAAPGQVAEMSATAYFFAEQLNRTLDVPVGILALPRGGARVESWLPRATVESYGTEDCSEEGQMKQVECVRAYVMYNGMEQPVKGYTARGFIWYQGCSNVGKHDEFVPRMTELVRQWREDWGDSENKMPFYQVEIAPFAYGGGQRGISAALRAAQHTVAKNIPNGGIVCTNDLVLPYEFDNIHPCKKQPVGQRLAYLALHRDYGFERIACYSPEAVGVSCDANDSSVLLVQLANCPEGIDRQHGIEGLEVAGQDGVFHPVEDAFMSWSDGNLRVSSPDVPNPVTVRYGWDDFCPGNLHGSDGLPLVPFCLKVE